MKKKLSVGLAFALVLMALSAAALAATLLLSPKVTAALAADRALEEKYGVSAEMQTFFHREERELADGFVEVTYTGSAELEYVLGTYTAVVKDGKAEVRWSHDGEDTSGGYASDAWGLEQLKQMMTDCLDEKAKAAYLRSAAAVAEKYDIREDNSPSEPVEDWFETIEAQKTAAMNARKVSEEEMIRIGRDFIISTYGLNEEQISRMELYTNFDAPGGAAAEAGDRGNGWYYMIDGKPCFKVEYLLGRSEAPETAGAPLPRDEMDGFYVVYVNVESGAIENYEYNAGLSGIG